MIKNFSSKVFAKAIFSAIILSSCSVSAMPLSLAESIELALMNDETITAAEYSQESAKWSLSAAKRRKGPTFSWSSQAYRIGGRDYKTYNNLHDAYGNSQTVTTLTGYLFGDEDYPVYGSQTVGSTAYKNTFANTLGISIPIYTGGQLEGNIKSREYSLNAADMSVEDARQTIKYQTTQAYYNVLQQQNAVKTNQSAIDMALGQLKLLREQYEAGTIAYSEVLQMEVQLANYQNNVTDAESNLSVAKERLLSIIGMPAGAEIELTEEFLYSAYPQTLEECLIFAEENRPDLAAAIYNVKQAEASVDSAKSGNRPTVTGNASKSISANQPFQDERSSNWQAGIALSWSIFDNQVTSANVKAAKAEVESLKTVADATEKQIKLQVRSAYTQMKAAEKKISSTENAVKQAATSYEIAQVRYEEGVDILLNVTDAQDKLTRARTNYYTALYEYNLYRAQLEKAMGMPVGLYVPKYISAEQEGKTSPKALKESEIIEVNTPFEQTTE